MAVWLCVVGPGIFAAPFSELSFEAACKEAAQTKKIVLVDFYTTWCGPCKLLDKNTWTDAGVIKVLEEKTVALRIDAEKETALSESYKIAVYPSVLLIKPDGMEIDRLVGYRDPNTFLADFNAALGGKDSVARAREQSTDAGTKDPMARMNLGKALAEKGEDAEALAEYLWCFDYGLEASSAFVGVRGSFLLSDIQQLAAHYPPAGKALETRRDACQAKVADGTIDLQTIMDLIDLNGALDQKEKNLAVYDGLPAGSLTRGFVASQLTEQFLEAKRYADVLQGDDGSSAFRKQVNQFNRTLGVLSKNHPMREQMEAGARQMTVTAGAHYFEALAGLKRDRDAKELAGQILKFDSTQVTRDSLAKAAERAGNAELSGYVQK